MSDPRHHGQAPGPATAADQADASLDAKLIALDAALGRAAARSLFARAMADCAGVPATNPPVVAPKAGR